MGQRSFLVASGDLIILFLYGAGIAYFSLHGFHIGVTSQLLASFVLAVILGAFGPSIGELTEWALFFSLGIVLVFLYPYFESIDPNSQLPLRELVQTAQMGALQAGKLLMAWLPGVPLGVIFFKLTDTGFRR